MPSTPMELVSRLTEQEVTPGTLDTAFSTRALQAAQLMPVTLYCLILFPSRKLFHHLLQGVHQLLDGLVPALSDILRNAGADMLRQQLLSEGVQRGVGGGDLA